MPTEAPRRKRTKRFVYDTDWQAARPETPLERRLRAARRRLEARAYRLALSLKGRVVTREVDPNTGEAVQIALHGHAVEKLAREVRALTCKVGRERKKRLMRARQSFAK
ncbi:MAG: hypothetical protein HOW73_43385 [Polyangiaceae bacterium]|nr:hypothetical protein [Polyangiaceae bacterium]